MTIRTVTSTVSFPWDCGTMTLPAGTILDVPPGGALETAILAAGAASRS